MRQRKRPRSERPRASRRSDRGDASFGRPIEPELLASTDDEIEERTSPLGPLTEATRDQACMDSALRFLAQRPRSEREVRRRLAEKGHEPERIERVLARLRELQLVDDHAFADYWLENRTLFKPRGARALRSELFQKGVPREVVDEALAVERDEPEEAYRAGLKRAATLSALDEKLFRQRLAQFLQRRGFGWESIEPAVDRLWRERTGDSESDDDGVESSRK